MPGKNVLSAEFEIDEEKKTITLTSTAVPPGSTPPAVHRAAVQGGRAGGNRGWRGRRHSAEGRPL